jgi:sulfur-oxidizing protein SoxY
MKNRRDFLKRSVAALNALFIGLVKPARSFAEDAKDSAAFTARDTASALAILGVQNPGSGKRILLNVPEIVDKNVVISIKVKSAIPNTDWIAVLIDKNQFPLVGQFDLVANKSTGIEVNAKLTQTSKIVAVVRADGKYYRVDKEVKVAIDGCG